VDRIIREHHAGPPRRPLSSGHPCGVSPACVLLTPDVAAFTDAIGTTNTDFARR
jgi:hypothetical protein